MTKARVQRMMTNEEMFTHQEALSMVMAQYDPLGLVSPALMKEKLLLGHSMDQRPHRDRLTTL